ncbi:MAG: hypothetical protein ACOC1P_02800 [Minisyncoccales bacterium]
MDKQLKKETIVVSLVNVSRHEKEELMTYLNENCWNWELQRE